MSGRRLVWPGLIGPFEAYMRDSVEVAEVRRPFRIVGPPGR